MSCTMSGHERKGQLMTTTYRYYSRMEPVGYAFHADIYCAECGHDLPPVDGEGNDKYPVMSWETSEMRYEQDGETHWDSCYVCGESVTEW